MVSTGPERLVMKKHVLASTDHSSTLPRAHVPTVAPKLKMHGMGARVAKMHMVHRYIRPQARSWQRVQRRVNDLLGCRPACYAVARLVDRR